MTKVEANKVARMALKAGQWGVTVCEWWDNGIRQDSKVTKRYSVECQNRAWVKRVYNTVSEAERDLA